MRGYRKKYILYKVYIHQTTSIYQNIHVCMFAYVSMYVDCLVVVCCFLLLVADYRVVCVVGGAQLWYAQSTLVPPLSHMYRTPFPLYLK
jgi:hypothetical protein